MIYKAQRILDDLNHYSNVNMRSNVEERLAKTLTRYLEEIDATYQRIKQKKLITVVKELSKDD